MVKNTQVIFSRIPDSYIPEVGKDMAIKETEFDLDAPLSNGQFILKQLSLSIDSYMRGRMRDPSVKSYVDAFEIGKPLKCGTMSLVTKSNNPKFKEGDLVQSSGGLFEQYTLVQDEKQAEEYQVKNDPRDTGLPPSYYLGLLGMPGMTAYVGMMKIGRPKKGKTLYVSAAASSVGQLAGQIGKVYGMTVVGSAGADDKTVYLKEIGFDEAFNYKNDDISTKLKEVCPKGIDIYFDNVGGKTLEAAIANCNNYGRIVACGMISQYAEHPETAHNLMQIIVKRLRVEGFIVSDEADMKEQFRKDVTQWLLDGKINYKESVAEGIEKAPEALIDVLQGKNLGKQIIKVADE
ncbi:hypothetical protein BDB00DRAFT_787986 [Zychaea mexicana]|uniref:uncharacterized protein n=1 Tax=Zychaea mexicana TaxID=64656 RepID=UPI0022FE36D8|nr:uncharacterized protein BDB00DRAFT_787986 [Zychaea mexicana]KAI9493502.1 hypothetical protein BDB00DRAFT_787986 [Zychaea mexicana]